MIEITHSGFLRPFTCIDNATLDWLQTENKVIGPTLFYNLLPTKESFQLIHGAIYMVGDINEALMQEAFIGQYLYTLGRVRYNDGYIEDQYILVGEPSYFRLLSVIPDTAKNTNEPRRVCLMTEFEELMTVIKKVNEEVHREPTNQKTENEGVDGSFQNNVFTLMPRMKT